MLTLFDFDGVLGLTVRGDLEDADDFGGVELEPDVVFDLETAI